MRIALPCPVRATNSLSPLESVISHLFYQLCLHYNCLDAKVNTISRVVRGQKMRNNKGIIKKQMFLSILASVANFNVHESKIGTQKYMYGTADISTNYDS